MIPSLAAFAVDIANHAGEGRVRQQFRKEYEEPIGQTGNDNGLSAECFREADTSGSLGSHAGVLVFFSNTCAGAEFRLCDAGAKYRDGNTGALQLIPKCSRKRQEESFARA